jgi:DNA-binding MarR family transcriptional regulator
MTTKVPAPAYETPGILLREVARLYVRKQRAQASCRDGASTVQCHVMTELLRQDGLTQQILVERLGLDKAWLSRAVDALVEAGAVRKQASPIDRRSVNLSLTRKGRSRAKKLELELKGHAVQLMDAIPKSKHAQIAESLQLLLVALGAGADVSLCVGPHPEPISTASNPNN